MAVTHLSLANVFLTEAVQSARIDGLEDFRIASANTNRTHKPVLKRSVTEMYRTETKQLYAKMEEHCQTALQIQRRINVSGKYVLRTWHCVYTNALLYISILFLENLFLQPLKKYLPQE